MKKHHNYTFVLALLVTICILPVIGSFVKNGGMPEGYGLFPAQLLEQPPGFSKIYFILFSAFALFLTLFLAVPQLFGFKVPKAAKESAAKPASTPFPWWFWVSLPITILSWFFM